MTERETMRKLLEDAVGYIKAGHYRKVFQSNNVCDYCSHDKHSLDSNGVRLCSSCPACGDNNFKGIKLC